WDVALGDDFELSLEAVSSGGQRRTVEAYVSGSVVYYTGVPARSYMKKLVEQANLHFIATAKVKETGQIITTMKTVVLRTPKLSLQISGSKKVNEEMTVTVDFTNPFSFVLEHVYIRIEGPGVLSSVFKYYGPGTTRVIATLDCAALRQVYGQIQLDVLP
ncbi:hypothetical protein CRUP_038155, partial [Coryphaenoides rupestris]